MATSTIKNSRSAEIDTLISDSMSAKGTLTSSDDLNNLTNGIYVWTTSRPQNIPNGQDYGLVEVFEGHTGPAYYNLQFCSLPGKAMYYRRKQGSASDGFADWARVARDDEINALKTSMGALKFFRDTANATTFTFTVADASRLRYFLLIGGTSASAPLLYHGFINTDDSVALNKIIDPASRTVSASYNGTTLTITSTATLYGGVRILYLD